MSDKDAAMERLRLYTGTKLEEIAVECRRRGLPMDKLTLIARQTGNDAMSIIKTNDSRDGIIRILDTIWPI